MIGIIGILGCSAAAIAAICGAVAAVVSAGCAIGGAVEAAKQKEMMAEEADKEKHRAKRKFSMEHSLAGKQALRARQNAASGILVSIVQNHRLKAERNRELRTEHRIGPRPSPHARINRSQHFYGATL